MAVSITGAGGSYNHNTPGASVSGSGFGTKSTAAPFLWDPCDHGQALSVRWDGGSFPNTGSAAINAKYDLLSNWSQPTLHSRITHAITGSHNGTDSATGGNFVGVIRNFASFASPQKVYISYYASLNSGFTAGSTFNLKQLYWNQDLGGPQNDNSFYLSNAYPPGTSQYAVEAASGGSGINGLPWPDNNGRTEFDGPVKQFTTRPNWVKVEQILVLNTTLGSIQQFDDNDITIDYVDQTDRWSSLGPDRSLFIGGFLNNTPQNGDWRHFITQAYVDKGVQRLMLTNNISYTASTIMEPQIITSWNDAAIGFTVNLGKLTSPGTGYLFAFDSTGARNSTGFAVSLGAANDSGAASSIGTGTASLAASSIARTAAFAAGAG